jgi:hypothetical protein
MSAKLAIMFLLMTVGFAMPVLLGIRGINDIQLPNIHTGYQPEQPISYSHRLHAGYLNIDCQYCHTGVEESRHATLPPLQTCMNCHMHVQGQTDEAKHNISKLIEAWGNGNGPGVQWKRVHNNPDFVYFNHMTHVKIANYVDDGGKVTKGIDCEVCHGDQKTVGVARQYQNLTMGWCINCNRDQNERQFKLGMAVRAPVNACDACHR